MPTYMPASGNSPHSGGITVTKPPATGQLILIWYLVRGMAVNSIK